MRKPMIAVLLAACAAALPTEAALRVFACEPEWAALATELGGERVSVYSATTAQQDVHRVEARPSLMAATRRAALLVCTGAGLESGWLPILLRESGNATIQPGRPGFLEAFRLVEPLEVPQRLDRSEGDVHPEGNPHIHLDPRNIARIAEALAARLAEIDPEGAQDYRARLQDFRARWDEAIPRWQQRAAPLRGVGVVEHHRTFTYLFAWLGMRVAGHLEPKPGLPPTAAQVSALLAAHRQSPVRMVVRANYQDPKPADWFAREAQVPAVTLPGTVGGTAESSNLQSLFDDLVDRLLRAAR